MDKEMINFTEKEFTEPEIDGVDKRDYPDFCDAFFSYGLVNGREATEEELEYATMEFGSLLNNMAHESLF